MWKRNRLMARALLTTLSISLFSFWPQAAPNVQAAVCTVTTTADGRPKIDPTATGPGTGKKVGFDNTHGSTAGSADWVIDGAFSDMACALAGQGYTIEEIRAYPLTLTTLNGYDVVVIPEPNIPLTTAEESSLANYVAGGKGLMLIADHYQADRNLNTWDSTEVFNGFRRGHYNTTYTTPYYKYNGVNQSTTYTFNTGNDWLGPTFGFRFRFNAVDMIDAVNSPIVAGNPADPDDPGILDPTNTYSLTTGVTSVAYYAGASISIVDSTKAMGIIYPNKGRLKMWASAQANDPIAMYTDNVGTPACGVTNGGRCEGAFAAIAKPNAGKVAALGDSSTFEDTTPKYKREDSGATKTTYLGWGDKNHATLGINLINWLATSDATVGIAPALQQSTTPEPYDIFTIGEPLVEPWSTPAAGYIWYDSTTFKAGSYTGGSSGGGGSGTGLVISEVFYDTPGTDSVEEWVELYNGTASAINLSGYTMTDNATTYTLPSYSLAAGALVVVASNTAGFHALYGFDPDISGMSISLGNSGDKISLKNPSGTEVDFVAWENYVAGWGINAATGQSIYRSNRNTDSNTVSDWVVGSPTPKQ